MKTKRRRPPFGSPLMHAAKVVPSNMRDGDKYGLTSGLSITKFMDELLYANYRRQKTDEELAVEVETEFPRVPRRLQLMSQYRGYFNSGKPVYAMGIGRPLHGKEKLPAFGTGARRVPVGTEVRLPSLTRGYNSENREQKHATGAIESEASRETFTSADATAIEGMLKEVRYFNRTRNRGLRNRKLLDSHGICEACGVDYSKVLSGLGLSVLIVHHNRRRLAEYVSKGECTSLADLSVVCANCHMLIHANPQNAVTVAQLRGSLQKVKG